MAFSHFIQCGLSKFYIEFDLIDHIGVTINFDGIFFDQVSGSFCRLGVLDNTIGRGLHHIIPGPFKRGAGV